MGLAVAFDLSDLVEGFPAGAGFDVILVQAFAEGFAFGKHDTVAQVTVVGDGKYLPGGLLFVTCQPFPQIGGVVAAEGFCRGVGIEQSRPATAVAVDDHSMQIVAVGGGSPFVTDHGGEAAGVVGLLGSLDHRLPGRAVGAGSGKGHDLLGYFSDGEGRD